MVEVLVKNLKAGDQFVHNNKACIATDKRWSGSKYFYLMCVELYSGHVFELTNQTIVYKAS